MQIAKIHQTPAYETWAPVLGRVFIAALLIVGGLAKVTGFDGNVAYAEAFGVPFPTVAIILAIIIELGGGLLMLVGFYTRLVAFITIVFLVVVTLFFHTNFADPMEQMQFLKNFAIIGGLLYLSVYGAQKAAVAKCPLPQGHHTHQDHA